MKRLPTLLLLCLSLVLTITAQENYFLTPQNKAYLFHTVRKSPILEKNIGRYIVYSGKEITLPNGEINYDSTEQVIINQPELLKIYANEIQRSPKGLLAELANKMAIWELNKVLKSHRSNDLLNDGLLTDYEKFETKLLLYLPQKAKKNKKDGLQVHRKVLKLSNPTLTFKDKVAMLDGFASWTENEKKQVILAYNKAINEWVKERTHEIFKLLGGKAEYFVNVLTAAGDGSTTSGLFEEREKDERGRFNKGLPKAVGLFPYEPYIGIKPNSKKEKPEVLSMGHTIHQFETVGQGKETNVHLDVWGYNSEKQTTVVIQKGKKYYPLFGSGDTRFISPDSSFGEGMTYYSLIHRIQRDIADLEDKISGKRGLDYWIEHYEDKRDDTKLSIDKTEKELNDIRYSTITTNSKKYKTDSKRSKRKKRQEKVVQLYGKLKSIEKKLVALAEEKEQVLVKKQVLNRKVQQMYDLIGQKWVPFTEKNGLYIYADSTRFDLLTQEFTFPANAEKEVFEIKLLAIPISYKSSQFDEVMLHINITDALPNYTSQIQLKMNDVFGVDDYKLPQNVLLQPSDSIAVKEFFEALLDKKKDFNIIARGGGIGKWKNEQVVIGDQKSEIDHYPGETNEMRKDSKNDSIFKRLRSTEVYIKIDRSTCLEINSYTDPVRSNFKPISSDLIKVQRNYELSGNQMLSAYRAYTTLKTLKNELNILAGNYLTREEAAKVIDRLNKAISKSKVTVGPTSIKYKAF
ncbi:hypothetical protein CW751_03585 [Brumimicrobium salinarum]|uniref:Uncharacterized protein n=1 Tax=Brumimicrobium salinarum TaxID=2058658 RepID=A0A2I0R4X0_9FLAO|nr:hypothetical protein [Brumimicrobium salinarum]PKR81618.1 hypothetical protein CW751_03585 [Brumimicrobium salinarum]